MRICIVTTMVPFVRGGAEVHAEQLQTALRKAGHEVELIFIPFKWYPAEKIVDHIMAVRLLDLSESSGVKVDKVIALKFPAYFIKHPDKVVWILHQHRAAYDLWDHPKFGDLANFPNGNNIKQIISAMDKKLLPEARKIFANSKNVADRLKNFCDLEAHPLYHPPQGDEKFFCAEDHNYFFYPSRINEIKRQELVIAAL